MHFHGSYRTVSFVYETGFLVMVILEGLQSTFKQISASERPVTERETMHHVASAI